MNIFFITGTGRSGTNMLRNMLRMHPNIDVMVETHFYPVLIERFGTDSIPFADFMDVIENHYNSDRIRWMDIILANEDVDTEIFWSFIEKERWANISRTISQHVKLITDAMYGEGKTIGDKTPNSGIYASKLLKVFPAAKFIHVRRDGVFSTLSMLEHSGFVKAINGLKNAEELDRAHYQGRHADFPDTPVTIEQAVDFWKKLARGLMQGLSSVPEDRVLDLTYEDLLRDPKPILVRTARFLDVAPHSVWLHEANQIVRPLALKRMSWKLPKAEYETVFALLGDTATDYGYQAQNYEAYRDFKASAIEWTRYLLGTVIAYCKEVTRKILRGIRDHEIARG